MKTNLLTERALNQNSAEIGAVTRKMVRERAVELALNNGRSTQDVSKSDWEQAKRELTGELNQPDPAATEEGKTRSQSLCNLIAQQPFFKGLNGKHLRLLTDSAMEMQFERGQSILQEGSPANRFFLILEGKVVLESEVKERGLIPIQTLGTGDDLGWSWLFPPYHLHLSARALEPTRTIFFYGTRLREQCEQDHELGYELMKRIAEVMMQRLLAAQKMLLECTDTCKLPHR